MIDYEVHKAAGDYFVKSSEFEVALASAKEMSLLEPREIFFISRVEPFDRATLCSFHNGRIVRSFLNQPLMPGAEA